MIAWMGWELINCNQHVDLTEFDLEKIIPQTKIPLGSYAEGQIHIKSNTLKVIRKMHQESKNY